jgi:PPOX class probable F420-dependent enzyme
MSSLATMAVPETHRDIVAASPVVTLATRGADGFPQVTALWFLVEEDGTIAVSLNTTRQKTRNLLHNPEATLFFIDPANPYRTLEIRARVGIEADPEYAFADRVGAKYGGANLREMDKPGESRVVVRFEPVKINTFGQ